jgi:hypothetical protein
MDIEFSGLDTVPPTPADMDFDDEKYNFLLLKEENLHYLIDKVGDAVVRNDIEELGLRMVELLVWGFNNGVEYQIKTADDVEKERVFSDEGEI